MISILKKNIIYIVFLFLLNLFPSFSYSSDVVYINLNKIMNNSIVCKHINTIIDNEQKKISEKFTNEEKELRNKENKLLGQKNILKKEEYLSQFIKLQNEVKFTLSDDNNSIEFIPKQNCQYGNYIIKKECLDY